MSVKVLELRRERANVITEARKIADAAEAENRDLTAEEQNNWDQHMARAQELARRIKREEDLQDEERELEQSLGRETVIDPKQPPSEENRSQSPFAAPEYRSAFQHYLRGGLGVLSQVEQRALSAGLDVEGGYTVAPEQFVATLIKALDDQVFIRGLATVETVDNAESLGVVSLDADPADADWTSELKTGNEDSAMAFGKRALFPHPLAKRVKVSNKLLRSSRLDIEALVRDRLAYKFGVSQEKAFMTGSGAEQPLGVFTASAQGISTSRDVSTGNTTTSIQTDGLQEALWTLKGTYRRSARWIFHRDALKQIAKLKDGDGQYIWQLGNIANSIPDRLLNVGYLESEFAPNTFTTGKYVGIIGDFSFYWIADALSMTVQRLVELYAETNQVGFIGRLETDGMPVLEEAFVRVKLA
ncbi:MAG TPA: phage major capsid protein [Dehalococcoidia bacterium]|nr:phage major capsid protein [Dehalococcoidia bacterium]